MLSTSIKKPRPSIAVVIILTLLVLGTIYIVGHGLGDLALAWRSSQPSRHQCTTPGLRREWRDLSLTEQQDYIKAAQCFSALPNPYRSNGTLYDEFSRVHRSTGSFCRCRPPDLGNYALIRITQHMSRHLSFPGIATSCIFMNRL